MEFCSGNILGNKVRWQKPDSLLFKAWQKQTRTYKYKIKIDTIKLQGDFSLKIPI
jgi:hypothetical protein